VSYDPTQPNQPNWGPPQDPYGQPQSGQPYNVPSSGQPYNPTSPLPPGDPYAQPVSGDPYGYPGQQQQPPNPGYGAPGGFPPPPPPPKRNTTPIIIGIVAVTILVIAVCGIGGFLISQSSDKDTTANSSTRPPTTGATTGGPTEAPTSSGPSIDSTRPLVAPAGAPYSWRIPTGFQEVTPPKSDTTGAAAKFTSAAAQSASETNDFLIVDSYTLNADADQVTVSALETEFDKLVRGAGQDATSRETGTVNGYRSLKYLFKYSTSSAYSYFIFKGTNEIQVRCQWADTETSIKTGCQYLLDTLSIT
jgi:hypothetical protein